MKNKTTCTILFEERYLATSMPGFYKIPDDCAGCSVRLVEFTNPELLPGEKFYVITERFWLYEMDPHATRIDTVRTGWINRAELIRCAVKYMDEWKKTVDALPADQVKEE